ncbi:MULTISPECIES: hypothetical protein [Staphylococcus]|nr:hypothetical protein [Staphylococcus simulans]MEB6837991.1 hypothetical protein [Staphylococcus simulans]
MKEHAPLNIEASYPSFEYQEKPFAGLTKLPQSNLLITTAGTFKDNLQTS